MSMELIAADFATPGLVGAAASFGIALVVSMIATPIVRGLAARWQCYDMPDSGLKPHQKAIPYLGGVAMFLGWVAALAYAVFKLGAASPMVACIGASGTILMLTGLVDDVRHLRPATRIVIQIVAAGL